MTDTGNLALANAADALQWPAGDTVILRSRVIRPGTPAARLSRFADPVWILQPAHPHAHHGVNSLHWPRFPEDLVPAFKTLALAVLDHPYPPALAIERRSTRMAIDTFSLTVRDLRVFAQWMSDQGMQAIAEVTPFALDAYRAHVLALAIPAPRQAKLLNAVRITWGFRDLLPSQCQLPEAAPWDGASGHDLARVTVRGGGCKTPRIPAATMEALLAWSLRMLEDLGPDIASAWEEYRQLNDGAHPSQRRFDGLAPALRLDLFLDDARRDGAALPGQRGPGGQWQVNPSHLSRLLGLRSNLPASQARRAAARSGLPVAPGSFIGTIRGRLDGRPWRDQPITVGEIQDLVRFLTAACFVIVSYLSGLRPGEALNLRRGCRDTDPGTGQLLLAGRSGKGTDRQPPAGGEDPLARPWVVVAPVHDAIAMLERLTPHSLIFPASHVRAQGRRSPGEHARVSRYLTRDLEQFTSWVNATFAGPGGTPQIPPDPAGHIHARRFRRTLAYFIVRRPRGLIAAALQYGHVSTRVTLSYSGTADTTWMEDLAVERLELVLEQADRDWALIEGGEHVSGPSAQEYRDRVARLRRFEGRVVSQARNIERLLARTDSSIHHGEAMTCVYTAETAACRKAMADQGLPAGNAPDESQCRASCQNLAWTDRDISHLGDRLTILEARAADPLAPRPLRDRALAQAARARDIIARHQATRPLASGGNYDKEDSRGRQAT
jgi:integrase